MLRKFLLLVALSASSLFAGSAEDEIIILEQDYNIVEQGKDGPQAKDVRQKLYISKEFICIDEFGGRAQQDKPTESIMIDLKNRMIVNLDHEFKKKVTESFDDRRKRIETRKKNAHEDIDAQPAGPQRDKLQKLYRAMLDDDRKFAFAKDAEERTVADVKCKVVKVISEDKKDYVPLQSCLHPELELPYDSAEVLYLLNIIGKRMSEFLHQHRSVFKMAPMELHLDLAYGGTLDTKTVKVAKVPRANVDLKARALGSPFEIPENYEERKKMGARTIKKENKGDKERAD